MCVLDPYAAIVLSKEREEGGTGKAVPAAVSACRRLRQGDDLKQRSEERHRKRSASVSVIG